MIHEYEEIKNTELDEDGKVYYNYDNEKFKVAWTPFPPIKGQKYSSQQFFLQATTIQEVLYHGTRGVGKSDALLACYLQLVGKGYGTKWRGVIFRQSINALGDLIKKSKDMFWAVFPEARFLAGKADYKWIFPDGEELLLRSLSDGKEGLDKYDQDYHGQEFSMIGFDELSLYACEDLYHQFKSCLRVSSANGKTPPLMIRATSNPYGKGKDWVKRYFIDDADERGLTTEKFDLDGIKVTKRRLNIFGTFKENPYLPEDYILQFAELKETNYPKFCAWFRGCWNTISGGQFGDIYNKDIHVLQEFQIPEGWYIDRAFDWGTSAPFCVGWFAESDGSGVTLPNGRFFCPPEGSIIMFKEYYGAKSLSKPNVGLGMSPADCAKNIVLIEKGIKSTIGNNYINNGSADCAMWAEGNTKGFVTIADHFKTNGVKWHKGKKGKGSRVVGCTLFKQFLNNAKNDSTDSPHFYVVDTCKFFINTVFSLARGEKNPADVDQTGADHAYDMLRYRLMSKKKGFTSNGGMF